MAIYPYKSASYRISGQCSTVVCIAGAYRDSNREPRIMNEISGDSRRLC